MKSLNRLVVLVVGMFMLGLLTGGILAAPGHQVTAAVAIVSPCGIYNLVAVHADGSVTQYPDAPPPAATLELLNALPETRLVIEQVPCPTMVQPQYEAQKQDRTEAFEARAETPQGDGAHRPAAG